MGVIDPSDELGDATLLFLLLCCLSSNCAPDYTRQEGEGEGEGEGDMSMFANHCLLLYNYICMAMDRRERDRHTHTHTHTHVNYRTFAGHFIMAMNLNHGNPYIHKHSTVPVLLSAPL